MPELGDNGPGQEQLVTFVIKNPSKHQDSFSLSVPSNASLADIQRKIADEYEGKPSPSSQTLIYAGKVLKDTSLTVRDILKQPLEPNVSHSMHLVVRAPLSKPIASAGGGERFLPSPSTSVASPHNTADPAPLHVDASSSTAATSGASGHPATEAPTAVESSSSPAAPNATPGTTAAALTSTNDQVFGFGSASPSPASSSTASAGLPAAVLSSSAAGVPPYPYMFFNPLSHVNVNPVMNNQLMATAYQAAYSAALQSMRQQMQIQAGTSTSTPAAGDSASSSAASTPAVPMGPHMLPVTAPLTPALLYYPAAYQQAAAAAAMSAAAAAQQGQQAPGAPAAQFAVPAPFAVPVMGMPAQLTAHPAAAAQQAGAAGGNAAAPAGRLGLRQRFPQGFNIVRLQGGMNAAAGQQGQQAVAAAAGAQQGVAQPHGHRRYRTRTITFRISMRTLLQMLVFGMVLYQHCTWPRLCILLAGSVILYATALWAPFRQFILSLAMPPRPEQLAEMQRRRQQQHQQAAAQLQQAQPALAPAAAPPASQQQQQQEQISNTVQQQPAGGQVAPAGGATAVPAVTAQAPAAAHAIPAAAAVAQAPAPPAAAGPGGQAGVPAWLQQGIVREILSVLVSFVTSLLPAWNYNPEDAAVFAAAQDMIAREAREQQQGGAGADEAVAAAAAAP